MPVLRTLLRCTDAAIRVAPRWVMDAAAELSAFPQRYPVPESTLVRLWVRPWAAELSPHLCTP